MERADLNHLVRAVPGVIQRGGCVFLVDPHMSAADRGQADALIASGAPAADPHEGWLCIRTGGTSGGIRFARHDERTLGAAVEGFCQHFGVSRVNAVGLLPAWHVSGLMARVRCAATGGTYVEVDWKGVEAGRLPTLPAGDCVLSLVPTQLQRLIVLPEAVEWLRQFRIIFLGGGPTWPALADTAATAGLRISLSYGMTETAAMIAAQQPEAFLAGDRSVGRVMPHAQARINDEGVVVVSGRSLFMGYFPGHRTSAEFATPDLGCFDEHGNLKLLGRADAVIITGGKKVQPAEVEAALRASGEFQDVIVVGIPHAEWGEVVVAAYPASAKRPDELRAISSLASYERPKRFIALDEWPRNAQGKVNRSALKAALAKVLT